MAALQSTGAISINDVAGVMGGSAPHSLSEYYRGGEWTPASRVVRDPTSGSVYNASYYYEAQTGGGVFVAWAGVGTYYPAGSPFDGTWYYYPDAFQYDTGEGTIGYSIYRQRTQNINANVPTSGAISMSNFYSAEKP